MHEQVGEVDHIPDLYIDESVLKQKFEHDKTVPVNEKNSLKIINELTSRP